MYLACFDYILMLREMIVERLCKKSYRNIGCGACKLFFYYLYNSAGIVLQSLWVKKKFEHIIRCVCMAVSLRSWLIIYAVRQQLNVGMLSAKISARIFFLCVVSNFIRIQTCAKMIVNNLYT